MQRSPRVRRGSICFLSSVLFFRRCHLISRKQAKDHDPEGNRSNIRLAGIGDDDDIDVDGLLKAFQRLKSIATEADLPALVVAIQSPKNNFWTRELFADPICYLGGVDYLEPLLEAAQLGLDEGHDNDGFDALLRDLA